jgi:O-antigen ligase
MPFAVSGAVLWIALFSLLPSVLSIPSTPETGRFSNFTSVGARWELWRLSIDAALANPWLGLGPMHFAYVDNGLAAHPHNFWLQLAAEWGIPAMLLVLFATLSLAVSLWRRLHQERDKSRRSVGIALLATAIAWGIGTMSDGYMVIPTSQAMSTAVLMLAVMWVRLEEPARAPSPRIDRLTRIVSTTFLAVALGVLAALPFTDFGQPTLREQAWRAEHPGQMMWPRFWQQGWIGPDSDATARPGGLADPTSK